ncbi:kirola-like [Salvia divinorum]|uniref:Kirola-like n=1 Tax=Salvia divinorum TaxID=28513 RepID=A0ABD1FM94_SALDI
MGKLVSQRNIKWEGDLFNLFLFPYQFAQVAPQTVHSCDILAGSWGTVGSTILWTYNVGGAKNVAKEIVEAIDKKKKSIAYKVIEGDPLKFYSEFKIICEVHESSGHDNLVTYTLEYEKRNVESPEPTGFMDLLLHQFSKEVDDCSHRLQPN